jgi:siroheme synthase-like protein
LSSVKSYPINLVRLEERRCVVVGGGDVARRKVESLLEAGAQQVVVISPELGDGLAQLQRRGRIQHLQHDYRPGDLEGAFLVIATTDDPEVNRAVWQEAEASDILVNVADDPEHCNFIVPSTLRRGDLVIGVSTGGQSPALAASLRRHLEQVFGPEYSAFLELAGGLRDRVARELPEGTRARFWYDLAGSKVLALLRDGREAEAHRLVDELLAAHLARTNGSARR